MASHVVEECRPMMRVAQIKTLISLPLEEKTWLVVLTIGSLLTKLMLRILSLNSFRRILGVHENNTEPVIPVTAEQLVKARRIGQLMHMISNKTVWESKCLPQALCVKWLLNWYQIPAVFYLGASMQANAASRLQAHAWVQVGHDVVVGGPQHAQYQVVATFVSREFI